VSTGYCLVEHHALDSESGGSGSGIRVGGLADYSFDSTTFFLDPENIPCPAGCFYRKRDNSNSSDVSYSF
jgi:hypothetical protein